MALQGEFRDVVTLFVNFQDAPSAEPGLMRTVLRLLHQIDAERIYDRE